MARAALLPSHRNDSHVEFRMVLDSGLWNGKRQQQSKEQAAASLNANRGWYVETYQPRNIGSSEGEE